jgi:hypothetical protein
MGGARDDAGQPVEERSLRPADDVDTPNPNPPGVAPASVARPDYSPGAEGALELVDEGPPPSRGVLLHASPWDGWPETWSLPAFGHLEPLVDTAWAAMDLNSSVFASMPPYLVGASPNLPDDWLDSPDPDLYDSWNEFAHGFMWDYLAGEAFVVATARYASGWPARFHLLPPWTVNVELEGGYRSYSVGGRPIPRAPRAQRLMTALSRWLVPRGTSIEVNRDEYVRPGPLERAQTWDILIRNEVLTSGEVREIERYSVAGTGATSALTSGVLK